MDTGSITFAQNLAVVPDPSRARATGQDPSLERQRIRQAAEDFEAVFLSQMLEPMFEGVETEGLFGGGSSEQIYRSIMLQEYGKALAQRGGVGIADAVEREVLKLQEVQ